jgi:hypothetical protein
MRPCACRVERCLGVVEELAPFDDGLPAVSARKPACTARRSSASFRESSFAFPALPSSDRSTRRSALAARTASTCLRFAFETCFRASSSFTWSRSSVNVSTPPPLS